MNRGFAFYFKNAMKSSAATIWKNKHVLQVWSYFLAELVARATLLFSAIFDLADIRQGKIAHKERKMDVSETLKEATRSKPLWTMVLSIILEAFIMLGGVLLIAVATGILYLIGFIVSKLVTVPWYAVYLFCIPGGLALLVYAVIMVLIFSPTPYIIETNPNLGVYETIKICFDTMKSNGKGTAFLNFFIPTLLELVILAICFGGLYTIRLFVPVKFKFIAFAGCLILSTVLILLTIPMFDLAKKIAQKSLFEDIVLDPVNGNRRTAGINIKSCNGVKFEKSEIKENLVSLFDETTTDSVPEPDSPARRKLKERSGRASKLKEKRAEREQPEKVQTEQPEKPVVPAVEPETQPVKPAVETEPVKPVSAEPSYEQPEQSEPVSVQSVIDQLNEPPTGEGEDFDLDKFVPEKFDLDKFIDAQVAEAQLMQSAPEKTERSAPDPEPAPAVPVQPEPTPEAPAEPQGETAEKPAEVKPKRTRTAKPKTEADGEAKPKRTRTAKPKTAPSAKQPEAEQSVAENSDNKTSE